MLIKYGSKYLICLLNHEIIHKADYIFTCQFVTLFYQDNCSRMLTGRHWNLKCDIFLVSSHLQENKSLRFHRKVWSTCQWVIQWNLVIKRSDITKPSYNKVILLVPALSISLFLYPDIMRNLIQSTLPKSNSHISPIIAKVEGLFKSSSLYILLFLTPHKSNFSKSKLFLQSQQIRLRQGWLYNKVIFMVPRTSL